MNLTDLKPKAVDFNCCGLDLTFRPYTIADDLKAAELCGGQAEMTKAFKEFDFKKISLIAWYQLELDSQRKVLNEVEGVTLDPETGVETKIDLKPIDKFRRLFLGFTGQTQLIVDLVRAKGVNIPDLDDTEALKKWTDQFKEMVPLTGQ